MAVPQNSIEKLFRRLRNSLGRSSVRGTIALCARALVFYARELTPARRRRRQREAEREAEFDARFGVKTGGTIDLVEVPILPTSSRLYGRSYAATANAVFVDMISCLHKHLAAAGLSFSDFVFVDFGSGLGRVLLMASEHPFRAIRGVEFSPEMHQIANQNIRSYRNPAQQCRDILSVCEDAAEYRLPDEASVFYLYNPFEEPVMARVIENIEQSLRRRPREAFLLYYNPVARDPIDRSASFRLLAECPTYALYRSNAGAVPLNAAAIERTASS